MTRRKDPDASGALVDSESNYETLYPNIITKSRFITPRA
jgi:hypothetical protein